MTSRLCTAIVHRRDMAGYSGGLRPVRRPKHWWKDLTEDDPITLEPISELPIPPFELKQENITHYFDAPVLAKYMLSHGECLPLTRRCSKAAAGRKLVMAQHVPLR